MVLLRTNFLNVKTKDSQNYSWKIIYFKKEINWEKCVDLIKVIESNKIVKYKSIWVS